MPHALQRRTPFLPSLHNGVCDDEQHIQVPDLRFALASFRCREEAPPPPPPPDDVDLGRPPFEVDCGLVPPVLLVLLPLPDFDRERPGMLPASSCAIDTAEYPSPP